MESTTERRSKLSGLCDRISGADSKNDLISAIDDALGVGAPEGDPATLELLGKKYKNQADDCDRLYDRVYAVGTGKIPEAWAGETSVLASDAVKATARAAEELIEAMRGGGNALITLSDAVEAAQKKDSGGRTKLRDARNQLGGEDGWFDTWHEDDGEENAKNKARELASLGCGERRKAAEDVDDAARTAARELNKWAAEARAGKIDGKGLSPVDKIMLADAANSGDPELNEILSANELERAGREMNNLSDADRARMDKMLSEASTPQEKAYLMKALAAGYDVDEVSQFQGKIHGKDPAWLEDHLAPFNTSGTSGTEQQMYDTENWSQDGPTCVPTSTIGARAMVDPVYALELTGGPDGTDDSPEAFRERFNDEQQDLYEDADGGYEYGWFGGEQTGVDNEGQNHINNQEISPHTGSEYEHKGVDSADDRRELLPEIERSVAEGQPVPINASRDGGGHSMVIVAQEGEMLQVYNPWGQTTWISEDDFIAGNVSGAMDDRADYDHDNSVGDVYVPKS